MSDPSIHEIVATNGRVIILDSEDADKLPENVHWSVNTWRGEAYPMTTTRVEGKHLYLHNVLFGRLNGRSILHHKNGNPHDFRKMNIERLQRTESRRTGKNGVPGLQKLRLQYGGELRLNGCILTPAVGRCAKYDTCPKAQSCLDYVSHNTNWQGFRGRACE